MNKLIKTSTFEMQLTTHFSSGERSTVKKSAPEFDINHNQSKITELFNEYSKHLFFKQNFSDNTCDETFSIYGQELFSYESRFGLTDDNLIIKDKDSLFKPYQSNVVTKEKAYFFKGKKITRATIGLKRIDSIEAELSLQVPTDFEKFSFNKSAKTTKYKDYTVEIESVKENLAQLKIPTVLYHEIIGYQATNGKNLRMNTSALSSTPILSVDKAVQDNLKGLLAIFDAALKEKDEKNTKEKLNQINQNQLNAKENMAEFDVYIGKLSKDKAKIKELGDIGLYNEIANASRKVLGLQKQFVVVEFPDDIKNIDVFVATKSTLLQNKKVVKYGGHYSNPKYFDKNRQNIVYYSKRNDGKFGISNSDGEVLIKPTYTELRQLANEYFMGDEELYWLDVANKKMVALPQYQNFEQSLKPGYDVFEKTVGDNYKVGVVLNREKVIIPFEYDQFEKYDHFIIASKSAFDELYDLNFKKLPNKGIQKISTIDKFISSTIKFPTILVGENSNKKKALVDQNLNVLTPFKYEFINPFFEINDYYIAGIRTADGSNYMYGIIDMRGKEVVSFIFCNIVDQFDENGKLKFCLKDKNEAMDFKSFLQKYKK